MPDLPRVRCGCGQVHHPPGICTTTFRRPTCQEHEPISPGSAHPMLRCHLPAGHHSQEHYDATFALIWIPTGVTVQAGTDPALLPADAPWADAAPG